VTVEPRHYSILVANLLLLIVVLLAGVASALPRRLLAGAFAFFFGLSTLAYVADRESNADWSTVARFIMAFERPGEPIFIFMRDQVLPFEYYYRGEGNLHGIPTDLDLEVPWSRGGESATIESKSQVHNRILSVLQGKHQFWVVERLGVGHETHGGRFLDEYVRSMPRVLRSKEFGAIRVFHLELESPGLQEW
jgi:hypothetical protein